MATVVHATPPLVANDVEGDEHPSLQRRYFFRNVSNHSAMLFNCHNFNVSKTLDENLGRYVNEHFPSQAGYGVFPQKDGTLALLVVDNKYSPQNYWNGSWKSYYVYDPSTDSINGEISVDVHYFEEGNVRLKTSKPVSIASSRDVIKDIKAEENEYQDELNRTFVGLNEGQFKALRRQLPVTRSKMTWGKAVGNYRLGKDIGGETTNQ
jgi:capping protein alpha